MEHEDKTICITCTSCDFINFTATNSNGNVFLINEGMNQSGSTFCYNFTGEQNGLLGIYSIDGYSQLEMPLGLCYDVTLSGNKPQVGAHIIVLIFIILAFIGVILLNLKFNVKERETLYKKIIIEYFKFKDNKYKSNMAYAIMYGIAYSILRMIFVLYYLLIIIFLAIFTEIVEAYSIVSLLTLLPQLFIISIYGLTIIGFIFIAILTEIIFKLIEDMTTELRGVGQ